MFLRTHEGRVQNPVVSVQLVLVAHDLRPLQPGLHPVAERVAAHPAEGIYRSGAAAKCRRSERRATGKTAPCSDCGAPREREEEELEEEELEEEEEEQQEETGSTSSLPLCTHMQEKLQLHGQSCARVSDGSRFPVFHPADRRGQEVTGEKVELKVAVCSHLQPRCLFLFPDMEEKE